MFILSNRICLLCVLIRVIFICTVSVRWKRISGLCCSDASRRFDFLGLSDHRIMLVQWKQTNSLKGYQLVLRMFPSEEVHTPDNPVHIVSFGAKEGITELYKPDEKM